METKRIDIRVPVKLLEEIKEYQNEKSISNRTTALLELVRKGMNKN